MAQGAQATVGVALIKLLELYEVDHVFGIPGVHTIELYRGLAASQIQHHTPRHEQGAGFMADGYARVSGKPGVCFVITGPGLSNIITPMGQALADSIPMLVISSVNDTVSTQQTKGMLHEMPNQLVLAQQVSRYSQTIHSLAQLTEALAQAFSLFASARPGPVHLQLPVTLLGTLVGPDFINHLGVKASAVNADAQAIQAAARLLNAAKRPLIIAGGGAVDAATEVQKLAEKIDASVHMTINARGLLSYKHALSVSATSTLHSVRDKVNEADVVLALGTELAATDNDQFQDGGFRIDGKLIRCDIDPLQINNNHLPAVGVVADSVSAARALYEAVDATDKRAGAQQAKDTMEAAYKELDSDTKRHLQIIEYLRDQLAGAVFVGDSTQLVYSGNMIFNTEQPKHWFNSSVGFGTLGYALPAATGAAIAVNTHNEATSKPVVCLIGDGGLQFVLGELGALKDTGLPVAVVVWRNNGYREIKTSMENAGVTTVGVEFSIPDFVSVASAYGIKSVRVNNEVDLCDQALESFSAGEPILIEVLESEIMG